MNNNSISLMYHDVIDRQVVISGFQNPEAQKYKIERTTFEEQIGMISRILESKKISKSNLYLTFDDGGVSFVDIIAPILEKYGFKGYFFITTNFINQKGFVSENSIAELDKRGHFIGIHSHTHPPNISLLKKEQLKFEWEKSMEILKGILKKDILFASIPSGFFSQQSLSVLSQNGVRMIFTSEPNSSIKEKKGVKIMGRYVITKNTKNEELVDLMQPISFIRFRKIAVWKTLSLIKMVMGKNYFRLKKLVKF